MNGERPFVSVDAHLEGRFGTFLRQNERAGNANVLQSHALPTPCAATRRHRRFHEAGGGEDRMPVDAVIDEIGEHAQVERRLPRGVRGA